MNKHSTVSTESQMSICRKTECHILKKVTVKLSFLPPILACLVCKNLGDAEQNPDLIRSMGSDVNYAIRIVTKIKGRN